MGMTVRLSDGRVTVTVEGVEEAKRIRDGQPEPPVAELLSGPDLLLIAQTATSWPTANRSKRN